MLVLNPFAEAARQFVASQLDLPAEQFAVSTPPKPDMGEFAVGCFPAAKKHKQAPAKLAAQVAAAFTPTNELSAASAAGPFVNFKVAQENLFRTVCTQPIALPTDVGADKTICIDYSSPNISKQLAYHHIRSTVIGHALVNLYRALGYRVIGINHLGDWGTTHGMLLAAHDRWGAPDPLTIESLNAMYVRFRKEMESDATLEELGRAWFKKLEDGEPEARALWQKFRDISWAEFQSVYDLLGIEFDEVRGESAYENDIEDVIGLLHDKGVTSESDGALVVAFPEADDMPPLLLRKADGATLYGTRDVAAALYRYDTYQFTANLYVVDRGQGLHFKQLFRALELAGYPWFSDCAHVPFGLVRIGGKKTGTRKGTVLLRDVLGEASERARARIRQNNPDMSDDLVGDTANQVGIGAVVFANLSSQREKDVDFEWEDVLSVKGDSGPYIQYSHARCSKILRDAGDLDEPDFGLLSTPDEVAVARKLLELGEVVQRAAHANEPHTLSRYLLDLSAAFARWYTAGNADKSLRILCETKAIRSARVALVSASQQVLAHGLAILGLQAPTAM